MKPVELSDAVLRIQWLLSNEAARMFPDTTRLEQIEICLGPILAYFEDHDLGETKR